MFDTHPHAIEERDFGRGPALWDADPDVCCAAFQLGACAHTEADNYLYDLDDEDDVVAPAPAATPDVPADDEPF